MVRMMRMVTLALCLVACSKPAAQQPSPSESEDATSANASALAANTGSGASSGSVAPVSYSAGQMLTVVKDKAPCRETGPDAGEPWELSIGAFVKFVGAEGSELRVEDAPGMTCLVSPDAVAAKKG